MLKTGVFPPFPGGLPKGRGRRERVTLRGVGGCSRKQLQSLQESPVLSQNSCTFYILFPLDPVYCHTHFPLSNNAASGSCSCLSVYPGAFHARVLSMSPGGVRSSVGAQAQMVGRCRGSCGPVCISGSGLSGPRRGTGFGGEGTSFWRAGGPWGGRDKHTPRVPSA